MIAARELFIRFLPRPLLRWLLRIPAMQPARAPLRLPAKVALGGQILIWRDALIVLRKDLMEPHAGKRKDVVPRCVFFCVGLLNLRRAVRELASQTDDREILNALGKFEGRVKRRTIERTRDVLHYLHEYSVGRGKHRKEGDPPELWEVNFDEEWNDLATLDKRDFVIRVGGHRLSITTAVQAVDELVAEVRGALLKRNEDHLARPSVRGDDRFTAAPNFPPTSPPGAETHDAQIALPVGVGDEEEAVRLEVGVEGHPEQALLAASVVHAAPNFPPTSPPKGHVNGP